MVMNRFGLIGVSALSLMLAFAATASAQDRDTRHVRRTAVQGITVAGDPNLPVENALRWGYSQGYSNYPSGWGGLYGDGRYPGNTISNPHPYNTLR
jgi:hypothetical protein